MTKSTTKRKTTTTRRKSTTKSATTKAAATEVSPMSEAIENPEVTEETGNSEAPSVDATDTDGTEDSQPTEMRKPELIDRVIACSGMKKKDVKPVVEAMLAVLGDAISKEEAMNLQPLGKIMVKRKKDLEKGEVMELRVRRSANALQNAEKDPLAEAAE